MDMTKNGFSEYWNQTSLIPVVYILPNECLAQAVDGNVGLPDGPLVSQLASVSAQRSTQHQGVKL